MNSRNIEREGLAVVYTFSTLAQSLEHRVVGEGVETEEQSRLLRLLNCDEMQGYLFSKPVPGEIFEATFLAPLRASGQPATTAGALRARTPLEAQLAMPAEAA
jgi:EAL domain-containing protein (putative c-di-GMP-specific phosphodiesterase class I)